MFLAIDVDVPHNSVSIVTSKAAMTILIIVKIRSMASILMTLKANGLLALSSLEKASPNDLNILAVEVNRNSSSVVMMHTSLRFSVKMKLAPTVSYGLICCSCNAVICMFAGLGMAEGAIHHLSPVLLLLTIDLLLLLAVLFELGVGLLLVRLVEVSGLLLLGLLGLLVVVVWVIVISAILLFRFTRPIFTALWSALWTLVMGAWTIILPSVTVKTALLRL